MVKTVNDVQHTDDPVAYREVDLRLYIHTEGTGFEPVEPLGSLAFETSAFVHSANLPTRDVSPHPPCAYKATW